MKAPCSPQTDLFTTRRESSLSRRCSLFQFHSCANGMLLAEPLHDWSCHALCEKLYQFLRDQTKDPQEAVTLVRFRMNCCATKTTTRTH